MPRFPSARTAFETCFAIIPGRFPTPSPQRPRPRLPPWRAALSLREGAHDQPRQFLVDEYLLPLVRPTGLELLRFGDWIEQAQGSIHASDSLAKRFQAPLGFGNEHRRFGALAPQGENDMVV